MTTGGFNSETVQGRHGWGAVERRFGNDSSVVSSGVADG
ncbi:Transposase [Shigella dysenteriae 1617]|uniref:Transposase n=1 Tax=Shigella dysenteriae 1617 TaxID=754093 RepID=A0A0A6ZW29_SHIDY|nr:Transposase [Shigella dysenteriae 1617]